MQIEPFQLPLSWKKCMARCIPRVGALGFILVFVLSLLFTVFLQERSGSHRAELSGYPDESAHYITGLMFRSYLHEGHFASPIRFAESYYLHYPKVAIGHWPPLYYLLQCLWTVAFPGTISSMLYLQAVLLALTAAILFATARRRFGVLVGCILSCVFLVLQPTQELGSEIMSEPLLTLTTLAAVLTIALYFARAYVASLIGFVALVEVVAHTKASGMALVGVPAVVAICLRRWDLLRNRTFWLAQLAMIVALVPWQVLTWRMVSNGTDGPASFRLAWVQLCEFGPIAVRIFGWPLLTLVLYGIYLTFASRKFRDPLLVCCAVSSMLTLIFHCVSPSGSEDRRLFMAIPGCLLLAPLPLLQLQARSRRSWTPLLLLSIAAVSLASTRHAFHKTTVGYRSVAQWLLTNHGRGENAVLIASDIDGEGMLISEIGQSQPVPSLYILRSSKLFEDCDWQRHDCVQQVTDPSRANEVVDSIPVRYVVLDRFSGIKSSPSTELVRRMIAGDPGLWILRNIQQATAPNSSENRGEIQIYERSGLNQSELVHVRVDLHRMIGRAIGN